MSNSWERTPIANSPLSVILLITDEKDEALQKSLLALQSEVKKLDRKVEILLPCTPAWTSSLLPILSSYPQARLIEDSSVAECVGTALKLGVAVAQYPLVFTIPAGYDPSLLPLFLKEIDLVDIVCGARNGRHKNWRSRQFFSVSYQLFGLWLQDPECPVRLYRREIFAHIPIQSKGAFAQIEILAKASFQSRLLTEVAIDGPLVEPASHSSDFWKVLRDPDFGPPPEKIVAAAPAKPIITTQAPETIKS